MHCFDQLLPEIVLLIMSYLKIQDLIHMGQVNSFLYELMKTPKALDCCLKVDFKLKYDMHSYEELKAFLQKIL
ncbi:hypothetical protein NQ314_004142 [Rhamnusium bicolor]|uniref:F-box domain-containing protein n=1 Tax=Rhamnusium bicolor TaxID=1586634 RepID=A0AAV8ZMR2_9CUCU|nr:hypothetical protein NQ314_004142 [Rhamnusium bicolor]